MRKFCLWKHWWMVILLPVLGVGFQSLAQLTFKNLDADLVVQQGRTESALPETMGLMIPYSAQLIAEKNWNSLRTIEGVTEVMGTVLLWNFSPGKFFSVSGIPPSNPQLKTKMKRQIRKT